MIQPLGEAQPRPLPIREKQLFRDCDGNKILESRAAFGHQYLAKVVLEDRKVVLRGLNVHGVGVSVNELGNARLRMLIIETMERMDVDTLVIEGAIRVTGANPGRKPRALGFTRKVAPAFHSRPE